MASRNSKRTRGSRRREILESEEFIVSMSERRKNVGLGFAIGLGLLFMLLVGLHAFGYAHLSSKTLYAIVTSLLATLAYVIRAAIK